jgi:plastocyanin
MGQDEMEAVVFSRGLFPAASIFAIVALAMLAPAVTTFNVTNNGMTSYTINAASNPTLSLTRGQSYTFQVNAVGHPFWIKSVRSTGTGNAYNSGVTNNGSETGSVTFVVPGDAPATLFYDCEFHSSMSGQINVMDPTPVWQTTWGRVKALFR